jgi:hypothetical protein
VRHPGRFAGGAPALAALLVVSVAALGGCASQGQPVATPFGACGDDARAPGAYPELEGRLPTSLGEAGKAPDSVDSGRSCSDKALGALRQHGVTELRFAGATWQEGNSDGTVIALLATPDGTAPLQEPWVEEFYEAGAQAGKKTDNIETSRPSFAGAGEVFRVDTLNDLSLQTVVTWQLDGETHVVIVATEVGPGADRAEHDRRVETAVAAAASAVGASAVGASAVAPAVGGPPCACAGPSSTAS